MRSAAAHPPDERQGIDMSGHCLSRGAAARRAQIIYGERAEPSADENSISYFHMSAETARQLIAEGFLDPKERHGRAPRAEEMLSFCEGEAGAHWYLHGFVVSAERADSRVALEGIGSDAPLGPAQRARFSRAFQDADILVTEEDKGCYCWYD